MAKRFAQVCVITPSSYNKDFFTYSIPDTKIPTPAIGSLVKVPFGKKVVKGLVVGLADHSEYKTKEVLGLERSFPVITAQQIQLANWMSEYYYCPKSLIYKYFLLNTYPKSFPDETFSATPQKLFVIPKPNFEHSTLYPKWPSIPVYSHSLKASLKQQIWAKIVDGTQTEVVGTRSSLFLPFRNLKQIEIIEADNTYHTERQSPYFSSVHIARALAKIFGAELNCSYSQRFNSELADRKILNLPPYEEVLRLSPINTSPKAFEEAQILYQSLSSKAENHTTKINVYSKFSNSKHIEIYITGNKIHSFLKEVPKKWRTKIIYLSND